MKEWEDAFLQELAFFLTVCELENPLPNMLTMSRIRLTDMLWERCKNYQENIQNPFNKELQDIWWEANRGRDAAN